MPFTQNKNVGKVFYLLSIIYVYLFLMLDILGLNPEDDGDLSFFALFPLVMLPMATIFFYILFDNTTRRYSKLKKFLNLVGSLLVLFVVFVFILNFIYGELTEFLSILYAFTWWGIAPLVPLLFYLLYKLTNYNSLFFYFSFFLFCWLASTSYPMKNYLAALYSNNPCATKKLIVRQYAGPAFMYQHKHGSVICIAQERVYPSETFEWVPLRSADVKSFENLGGGYSRDKNHVFYKGRVIEADPKTFTVDAKWKTEKMTNWIRGGTSYKRDAHDVYYNGEKLPVSDISNFKIIDLCHSYRCATDGTVIFKDGQIIKDLDPKKIISLNSCEYSKDLTNVYYSTKVIPGADAKTFDIYSSEDNYCYAYDKLNVYYKGLLLPDANPKKLHRIKKGDRQSPYTDGKNIYYYEKKLDIDINNYEYLGKSTIKDKHSVYYNNKKILGADPSTFRLVPFDALNMLAQDKNNCYFDGEIDTPPTRCDQ